MQCVLACSPSRLTLPLILALMLTACGEPAAPPPTQAGPVEVTAIQTTAQDLPVVNEFVGQTESAQQVEIRARINGFLERRLYTEGELVRKGQPLFLIDPKPFEAQLAAARAELAQQEAAWQNARANLARVRPLAEEDALSRKDLDDAEGSEKSAAAAVVAARAKVDQAELSLGYTRIESPVTGLASFAKQQPGSYIDTSNSLLTYVSALQPMRINISISENQLLRVKDAVAAGRLKVSDTLRMEIVLSDGKVHPEVGIVTFADPNFSQTTGTFLVRGEVPNAKRELRPGQFVRVRLQGAIRPNAILVPQRSVIQTAQGNLVFVVGQDGKAQPRPVQPGELVGDQWEIAQGLHAGETVVVDGAVRLKPGVPVKVSAPSAPAAAAPQS